MPHEETSVNENPGAVASSEPTVAAQDVISQIDCEFERYRAMRAAVRKHSGKWRRSFLAEQLDG